VAASTLAFSTAASESLSSFSKSPILAFTSFSSVSDS